MHIRHEKVFKIFRMHINGDALEFLVSQSYTSSSTDDLPIVAYKMEPATSYQDLSRILQCHTGLRTERLITHMLLVE